MKDTSSHVQPSVLLLWIGAAALVFCGYAGGTALYWFCAAALIVSLFAIGRWCYQLRSQLVSLGRGCTGLGIGALLGAVQQQAEELRAGEWEREMSRGINRPLEEHPLFRELVHPAALKQLTDQELGARILTIAAGFTRARAAAVVFDDSSAGASRTSSPKEEFAPCVVSFGIHGRRFEKAVCALTSSFLTPPGKGDSLSAGTLFDGFESRDRWGGMASFGHRFSLVYPIAVNDQGRKLALWLGYAHSAKPSLQEMEIASQIAQTLARTLCSITRLRALDMRAQEAEQERSQTALLLSQVSHDVRTPLSNVQAILHLLRDQQLSEQERDEFIETAFENCESLGELVRDVIDFTRGKSGALATRRAPVNVGSLVERVVSQFRVAAQQRGVGLKFDPPEHPLWVLGDESQLRRVFSNLISNACKYCPSGAIQVSVASKVDRDGRSQVEISVCDTGLGMDAEQLSKLFTPFARFHREVADGIGLGLTIVKLFVEQHKGHIEVRSERGVGTSCVVTIAEYRQTHSSVMSSRARNDQSETRLRLLVVDDDADMVSSLARALRLHGAECGVVVHEAVGVRAAKEALSESDFDGVITDWEMPEGGGRAVILSAFENSRRSAVSPRIVVQCGGVDAAVVREATALGATDVLEKPVDVTEILERFNLSASQAQLAV